MEAIALKTYETDDGWANLEDIVDCEDGTAVTMPEDEVQQTEGYVVNVGETSFTVENITGRFEAVLAASCLLEPELGDRILIVNLGRREAFILAVLERDPTRDARIVSPGNLSLHLGSGEFTVAAREGVKIFSEQTVAIGADIIETNAREARFFIGSARLVGKVVDTVVGRLSQRVKQSFRRIDGMDHLRAGQLDHEAEGMARIHGENTFVSASNLVRADGAQVHIG